MTEAARPTAAELLAQAMHAHGQGQMDAAQTLYQRVLAAAPEHADALHLLGVLAAQRGDLVRAAALITRAIAAHPQEAMFHNNLGNVCLEDGRFDAAEQCYSRALTLDSSRLDAMNNLAVLLSRRGRGASAELAEQAFLRVMSQAPEFVDARQNLANHYLRVGRDSDAVRLCVEGLVVAPLNGSLRRILGSAYVLMGMPQQAAAVYRAWLAAEPGNPVAQFHLIAASGEGVPARAPDEYVTGVFDSFARSFDAKLAALEYRAPELVASAVARHLPPAARQFDVLDAGCGTGLCGPLLAGFARRLVGVDLSAGMLNKASARQVYDELVQAELVAFLQRQQRACDLLVSADTLCYFGDLTAFTAAAAAALRDGGLLAFTVEALAGDDANFHLQGHGRYSHRRAYIEALLREAGFELLELASVVLRLEGGKPVAGWLVCARR